ncbi:MAG: hypothetical protein DRP84_07125 [Spirochaetes bacterium]|nr:MAG: hypothetical protein DRP84_07125 [Spirochaetota bacterium]
MIRDKISPFKQKDIVLAYIAKWRPSKNHLFLLKLLLKLPERFKVILGGPIVKGGPYFDRDNRILNYAKEFIKNNSLEDRVLLLDKFVENINDYIATSDVYLMPTKEEALGTPLLEAIAVGRPVIANNLVEVWRELAQEIPSLFLIPLDEKAWIESIYNALAIEQEILRSSSKKVLNSFSSEVIDEKYYCILEGLKMGKGYKEILSSV